MKKLVHFLCAVLMLALFTNCTKDDVKVSILGTWKLTTWTIDVPLDLNSDTITSTNLLDEVSCANNETLVFETNGVMSSNNSFSPKIEIVLLNNTIDTYVFDIECLEGVIGFATTYIHTSDDVIVFNDKEALVNGNQLICVYEDAIKIYSENMSNILETKDLKLVYTRQ